MKTLMEEYPTEVGITMAGNMKVWEIYWNMICYLHL